MSNDMRSAFQKAGIRPGGGEMTKRCKECGKEFVPKEHYHTICSECNKNKKRYSGGGGKRQLSLPQNYLKAGYFDEKGCLRESIYKDEAKVVAEILASHGMTPTSFRAFYNKAKAIEYHYNTSKDFDSIKHKLFAFERDVVYQVSRECVPDEFRKFIVKNAELAQKGPKEFKGFIEHFLSVLAYFKDYSKK